MDRKKFASNTVINVLGMVVYTAAQQLLIYPILAKSMASDGYGRVLLLMGFCNICSIMFGTALHNARLVVDIDYRKKGYNGDFAPLFVIACILDCIAVFGATYFFDSSFNGTETSLLCILSIFETFRFYYSVKYMLALDFKKMFLQNLFYAIGAVIGIIIFSVFHTSWLVPFMCSALTACIYTVFSAKIKEERFVWTPQVKKTLKVYLSFMITLFLGNAVSYLDRLVLYPLMGGTDVAVYSTAVFFGKSIGIFLLPLSNVLLAYFAKRESIGRGTFVKLALLFIGVGMAFYLLTLTGIAEWVTGILYPTLIQGAVPYIMVGNLAAIILGVSIMMQPAVMRFCNARWQPIIQGVNIALSLGLGVIWLQSYGLMGFCVATVVANLVKVIMMFVVGTISLKTQKRIVPEMK
ncbi:MAG: hypothetical protein RR716_01885 [Christensenellaceae bacterium]